MLHLGCSGFSVPATRYFREFAFVEVADTFLGVPGPALVRRWLREAAEGFVFTALAPRDLTLNGYQPAPFPTSVWDAFVPVARELSARAIVVTSPTEVALSKTTRTAAKTLLSTVHTAGVSPVTVWEPPVQWDIKECEAIAKEAGVLVARDPVRHPAPARGALAYFRLPGPAGHKSRYEDPTLERAAKTIRSTRSEERFVVFANVDMHADSKRLGALLTE